MGRRYIELPQGGWERPDVDPEEMARGELREETGLRADRLTELAQAQIGYGVMNQRHHIFLAEGLTRGENSRDPEEHDMEVHRVTVSEFEEMMLDGRVVDNCTLAAWGIYLLWKKRRENRSA